MDFELEGVGRSLSVPEANRGVLYQASMSGQPVVCLGFQDPSNIDMPYTLVFAGGVPVLTILDGSDHISGPRVSFDGKLKFRALPTPPFEFTVPDASPAFGALAMAEDRVWLVTERPRYARGQWFIDLSSGTASDRRPEGAFYVRHWELVEEIAEGHRRVLSRWIGLPEKGT